MALIQIFDLRIVSTTNNDLTSEVKISMQENIWHEESCLYY
jgi:hypothetical protein